MKIALRMFAWLFWRHLHRGMHRVTGFKTLADANRYSMLLCREIKALNGLPENAKLSWDNTQKTNEDFAKYITIRHFYKIGELLALFRAIHLKKITGAAK